MKKLISGLILIVLFLIYIIWIQGDKNDQAKIKIKSLLEQNLKLIDKNAKLSDSIAQLHRQIILKEIIEVKLDKDNKILRDGVAYKEEQLRNMQNNYTKLSNDSLLKSLIKAYEIDSISRTNK